MTLILFLHGTYILKIWRILFLFPDDLFGPPEDDHENYEEEDSPFGTKGGLFGAGGGLFDDEEDGVSDFYSGLSNCCKLIYVNLEEMFGGTWNSSFLPHRVSTTT